MHSKKTIIYFLFLILFACNTSLHKKEIIFSCIHCKGCVERQLNFIENHSLDEQFNLIVDTNCIAKSFFSRGLKYTYKNQEAIFLEYGEFGNILFFDSTGNKIELLTDMNLRNYINVVEVE